MAAYESGTEIMMKGLTYECKTLADNTKEYRVASVLPVFGQGALLTAFALACGLFLTSSSVLFFLISLLTGAFLWSRLNSVQSETLLVVRDVGVQVTTTRLFSRTSTRFIDRARIVDFIIIEGLTLLRFRPYIAIIVDGEEKMTVVFENLLPPLDILQRVLGGAKTLALGDGSKP